MYNFNLFFSTSHQAGKKAGSLYQMTSSQNFDPTTDTVYFTVTELLVVQMAIGYTGLHLPSVPWQFERQTFHMICLALGLSISAL